MYKVAITGHRPHKLIGGYNVNHASNKELKERLKSILKEIAQNEPAILGISGMALGVDTYFAESVLDLKELEPKKYFLECAIPFEGQEGKWFKADQDWYHTILSFADTKTIVSKGTYHPRLMQIRNEYMVDNCDVLIAVWDGKPNGGTYQAIQYAEKLNKTIIYVNTGVKIS